MDLYRLEKAPVMELVDMRVLGTRAFGVSVRVRPGAMGLMTMPATSVDLKISSHNALFLAFYLPASQFFIFRQKKKIVFSTLLIVRRW